MKVVGLCMCVCVCECVRLWHLDFLYLLPFVCAYSEDMGCGRCWIAWRWWWWWWWGDGGGDGENETTFSFKHCDKKGGNAGEREREKNPIILGTTSVLFRWGGGGEWERAITDFGAWLTDLLIERGASYIHPPSKEESKSSKIKILKVLWSSPPPSSCSMLEACTWGEVN